MAQAATKVIAASASEIRRHRKFRRELAVMDQAARLQYSEAKGKTEGKAEVALRMLQKKMPLADIVELSGLSEADVKRLATGKKL